MPESGGGNPDKGKREGTSTLLPPSQKLQSAETRFDKFQTLKSVDFIEETTKRVRLQSFVSPVHHPGMACVSLKDTLILPLNDTNIKLI